ncbi:MAG TPA: NAD(+)/NADH kinase [Thermomicrobiales bacterium]|nr:NAD(+)/NADH kinase [Thermomicrobiales bacterium]
MSQRLGIVAALSKPEAEALGATISAWLRERGHTPVPEAQLNADGVADVDAIIVLGGDGLMMRAANAYPDVPLFGINFGKVGFLALVEQKDWETALGLFLEGKFEVEISSTLQADLYRDGNEYDQGWAINDVVVRSGNRMIDIELYIDGYYVNTYPGDGMIVSTARGSTAYCMAAGGPILTAGVRGFAIVPINCHSPIRTPMVASEEGLIELIATNDHEGSLILDGQATMAVRRNDLVKIRRGQHTFQLVKVGQTSFYDAIREKFNFQIRPDAIPTRLAHPHLKDLDDATVRA